MNFSIGQIFTDTYPPEAAIWANENAACLVKVASSFELQNQISPSLKEMQKNLIHEVNNLRDAKEQEYFIYDGSAFDADATSAQRIALAAQTATYATQHSTEWNISWTLYDNSERVLNATDMPLIVNALASWSATVHAFAQSLKQKIVQCSQIEELQSLDTLSGWPKPSDLQ